MSPSIGEGALIEEALWTVADVARLLKTSHSWLYKAANRGEIPCVHIGAMLRFEPEAIRAWLAQRRSALTVIGNESVQVGSAKEKG